LPGAWNETLEIFKLFGIFLKKLVFGYWPIYSNVEFPVLSFCRAMHFVSKAASLDSLTITSPSSHLLMCNSHYSDVQIAEAQTFT